MRWQSWSKFWMVVGRAGDVCMYVGMYLCRGDALLGSGWGGCQRRGITYMSADITVGVWRCVVRISWPKGQMRFDCVHIRCLIRQSCFPDITRASESQKVDSGDLPCIGKIRRVRDCKHVRQYGTELTGPPEVVCSAQDSKPRRRTQAPLGQGVAAVEQRAQLGGFGLAFGI